MLTNLIKFCLDNRLIVIILLLMVIFWGLINSPFDPGIEQIPRDPVAVDAIPDIGENQQIVFYFMARPLSPGCGRPDHLPFDFFIIGSARC